MNKGLSRRNLFKYMGAGGAATVAAACEQKPEKLIPMLVTPTNFEYTPHTAYQYMSTCTECEAGCGMMVTVRENRAQKAEGNPLHPMNQGALCARGQASMLMFLLLDASEHSLMNKLYEEAKFDQVVANIGEFSDGTEG